MINDNQKPHTKVVFVQMSSWASNIKGSPSAKVHRNHRRVHVGSSCVTEREKRKKSKKKELRGDDQEAVRGLRAELVWGWQLM